MALRKGGHPGERIRREVRPLWTGERRLASPHVECSDGFRGTGGARPEATRREERDAGGLPGRGVVPPGEPLSFPSMSAASPTHYVLLGGDDGIRRLVDRFYDLMDTAPEAATIRRLHATTP